MSADQPAGPSLEKPADETGAGAFAVPEPGAVPAPYGLPTAAPVSPDAYGQAYGVPPELRATAGIRFGAYLLDGLLMIVTLFIGWVVWTMITWSKHSANPGQKILGLAVVKADTGVRLTWGQMFLRNFVFGGIVMYVLGGITIGILHLVNLFMPFSASRQSLVDKMAGTVLVRTK